MNVPSSDDDGKGDGSVNPLSNSGFCGQIINNRSPVIISAPVQYTLDKVSFTVPMPSQHLESPPVLLMWRSVRDLLEAGGVRHGKSRMYAAHWTYRECIDVQYGLTSESHNDSLRFEFNPSHCDLALFGAWAEAIPSHKWSLAKVTRCDWAADYAVDVHAGRWLFAGSSSQCIYIDSYQIETLYLGKRSSDRQFRIYNKLVETLAKRPKSPRVRRPSMPPDYASLEDRCLLEAEAQEAELQEEIRDCVAWEEFQETLPVWAREKPIDRVPQWWRVEVQDRRERLLFGSAGKIEDPYAGLMARGELSGPFLALTREMHLKGLGAIKGWVQSWGGPKCWARHWEKHIGPSQVALPTLPETLALWADFERRLFAVVGSASRSHRL